MRRTLLLGLTGPFLLAYAASSREPVPVGLAALPGQVDEKLSHDRPTINLSEAHRKAAHRHRRIIFQDDVGCAGMPFTKGDLSPEQMDDAVGYHMSRLDAEPNQIDSVWHEWGEGNIAQWPSTVLPPNREIFPTMWEAGLDPVKLLLEGVKKRGREVFFSYRVNGSDNGFGEFKPPMKIDHPEWLISTERKVDHPEWKISIWYDFWDFSFQEVRDYKVKILREVAEIYDFDGISIDFARVPLLFPEGTQWQRRDLLTDFMRQVRVALLEVEQKRGRPFLLAARVPENLMGCHFDGLDVETWARENLVDIFVVGCRSSDADLPSFRRITAGTGIKLYPSFDDHHSSDGYIEPSVELWRGGLYKLVAAGRDGMHTFNLVYPHPEAAARLGLENTFSMGRDLGWGRQREVYRDIGSLETLKRKDKMFYVQRRGGGHGKTVVPNPEDWHTPRHMYFNTNMFAPLPVPLDNAGKADTLLTLYAGDDVMSAGQNLKSLTLHLLLSDPEATDMADDERLQAVRVAPRRHLDHIPPAKGIEKSIEVRLNNLPLGEGRIEAGWLDLDVQPVQLAQGENLVGIRVKSRAKDARHPLHIEKLELHVRYRS